MANKNIMDLTENTSPSRTDAVEIDDGVNSEYVTINNLAAMIAESSNNAEDIYRVNSSGLSDFVATIASVSGSTLVYNAPSSGNAASIKPASSGQLAKLRIYNTSNTPVDYLLISSVDTGTNTITFTSAVPGTWTAGETITSRSQTNTNTLSSSYFQDLEITSGPTGKSGLFVFCGFSDSGGAGQSIQIHPHATHSASKNQSITTQSTSQITCTLLVQVTSNVLCVRWTASGAATALPLLRLSGTLL